MVLELHITDVTDMRRQEEGTQSCSEENDACAVQ